MGPSTDLTDMLLAAEVEGWEALTTSDGAAYYATNLTAEAVMAFPFGVMSRDEALEAMRSAPPWSSYEISEPIAVPLTADSGVLVYRVSARRGGSAPYRAQVTSVFVRRDDGWLLAFHQQTPLVEGGQTT